MRIVRFTDAYLADDAGKAALQRNCGMASSAVIETGESERAIEAMDQSDPGVARSRC